MSLVEITSSAIIEEIIDPLMMGELATACAAVDFRRVASNEVVLDFGLPDRVFVLTVAERPRS